MLAPPERRVADRRRKRKERARRKNGLHRCTLWLTDRALEQLITQFVLDGWLTEQQALHHRNVESALAFLLEQHSHV